MLCCSCLGVKETRSAVKQYKIELLLSVFVCCMFHCLDMVTNSNLAKWNVNSDWNGKANPVLKVQTYWREMCYKCTEERCVKTKVTDIAAKLQTMTECYQVPFLGHVSQKKTFFFLNEEDEGSVESLLKWLKIRNSLSSLLVQFVLICCLSRHWHLFLTKVPSSVSPYNFSCRGIGSGWGLVRSFAWVCCVNGMPGEYVNASRDVPDLNLAKDKDWWKTNV